jgi:hypothetical protein
MIRALPALAPGLALAGCVGFSSSNPAPRDGAAGPAVMR